MQDNPSYGKNMKKRSDRLDYYRDSLPAADAGGRYSITATTALELVGQRQHQPGACGCQGVAQAHRSAIYVYPLEVDAEVVYARHGLASEGLVDLPAIDVASREASAP